MRTTEAARYARWAAGAAILLAAIVAGVFAYRSWQAGRLRRQAPPAVPATVQQRTAEFSFSKVDQTHTLFTVRASRATEFAQGNKNLLEDVWITVYGRGGQRHDTIHTQACDYVSDTGRVVCAGEVQINLESAEEARRRPGQRVIHIATSNVSFERDSGEARSDRPVFFRFPSGQGRAVGVRYSSQTGVVRLERDVELTLTPAGVSSGDTPQAITLTGDSLEYQHEQRALRLLAPVRARQGPRELVAGELRLELDGRMRGQRLVARQAPVLRGQTPATQAVLSAKEFVALFHPEGWAERVVASGNVRGQQKKADGEDRFVAERVEIELVPRRSEPRLLVAAGGVTAQSNRPGVSRHLETASLRLMFGQGTGRGQLERAESLAPATVDWQAAKGSVATETTQLRAHRLSAEFDRRGQLERLVGREAVEFQRKRSGRPAQVSTSRDFVAAFASDGDWREIEQAGKVRLREADRTAQADQARYHRASEKVILTGSALLTDSASRTSARMISFDERSGELRAEGDVRSSNLSGARKTVPNFAPQPAHISAERLVADTSAGRATYSGGARLWQGHAVIEAETIELTRSSGMLNARGHVRAVFPQASASGGASRGSPARLPGGRGAEQNLWRVRAGALTYWSGEARARLEQEVTAGSRQGEIHSRALDLYFSPESGAGSARQLARAVATGGVTVRQGERRATSERAEYFAAEQKFILSGGHPTLEDASRGTVTGRQLTFFYANDTIIVDSQEGSRTLTRHRVEK